MFYILNEAGDVQAVDDVLTWALWFEKSDKRVLRQDYLDNPFPPTQEQIPYLLHRHPDLEEAIVKGDWRVMVSTVFLGLDHNWWKGDPILWETMTFFGPLHEDQRRYSSKEAALAGHEEALANAKSAVAVGQINYR